MTTQEMIARCYEMLEKNKQEIEMMRIKLDGMNARLVRLGDDIRDFRYDVESNIRRLHK